MEEWERQHIRKNLTTLLRDTNCNENFLSMLIREDVITDHEREAIVS